MGPVNTTPPFCIDDSRGERWFVCHECNGVIRHDDEVWIDPTTKQATTEGMPFHVECAPEQPDYDVEN